MIDKHVDTIERQLNRQRKKNVYSAIKQTGGHWTDIRGDRNAYRQTGGYTCRQPYRQTGRQRGRHADRQRGADRQPVVKTYETQAGR